MHIMFQVPHQNCSWLDGLPASSSQSNAGPSIRPHTLAIGIDSNIPLDEIGDSKTPTLHDAAAAVTPPDEVNEVLIETSLWQSTN